MISEYFSVTVLTIVKNLVLGLGEAERRIEMDGDGWRRQSRLLFRNIFEISEMNKNELTCLTQIRTTMPVCLCEDHFVLIYFTMILNFE